MRGNPVASIGVSAGVSIGLIAEVADAQAMGRLVNMAFGLAAMDMVCRVLSV